MAAFTISSASTLKNCRYPFRTDVEMPAQGEPDVEQAKGTAIHSAIARYVNTGTDTHGLGPAWDCALAWLKSNWRQGWVGEPAYAWNPATDEARLLGVDIGRDYTAHGRRPDEAGGTLDACYVDGDTVYVYEFGTGHDVSHKYEQLKLQCVVAARAHGCSRAIGQLVRFADDGTYPGQPLELDEFDLAAIAGEFAEYLMEVPGSKPTPGEHCQRCNLAPVCPAAADIVQALLPAEGLVKPGWGLTIANPDHAAWLLNHARLVAAAAEAVKEQVKAYVPKEGLVLADGSMLVEGTRNMPRTDNRRVMALAVSLGATPEQIESCNYVAVESSGLKIKKPAKAKRRRAA